MFLIETTYVKSIEEVDRLLTLHRNFLETHYQKGNLICSGPKNPRVGGLLLTRFKTLAEVEEFAQHDPFYIEGIATYRIIEFNPVKSASEFQILLK